MCYHWRGAATSIIFVATKVLARQARVCLDKTRLLSRQSMLVATKLLSRQNYVCRDKYLSQKGSVATKYVSRDKHTFVATKDVFRRDKPVSVATKVVSRQKRYLRQVPPMIVCRAVLLRDGTTTRLAVAACGWPGQDSGTARRKEAGLRAGDGQRSGVVNRPRC